MKLPQRKALRLKNYDYSTPGMYFITLCTKHHKELLSKIEVGTGLPDCPQSKLTKYGEIANSQLSVMSDYYENIKIDKFVVMPNHVHMIIHILEKEIAYGQSGTPVPTTSGEERCSRGAANSLIPKFVSSFKRFCNKKYGENIWQSRYHDHIIRNTADYEKIWNYIDTNPIRWELDCFYNAENTSGRTYDDNLKIL